MKLIIAIMLLAGVATACSKDNDTESNALEGAYIGYFTRTGMDTASVTLRFTENHFEGETDKPQYPAICRGSFSLDGPMINFADSCTWTANFDWTLILNGGYTFSQEGNNLHITRTNGNITDEYRLARLSR